jgi:required for meiotic nuclear division protein 1
MVLKVQSYQISESIDIKSFKAAFTGNIFHAEADELFYEIASQKYLYVFKYGVVCFLGYNETEKSAFIQLIKTHCKNILEEKLNEEFEIETNAVKIKFGFNRIELVKADEEMLRLVMLNVSQSVALDHYLTQTNALLEETNFHTQTLELKGSLSISGRNLKKYIGRTLNIKNRIAENLYIFDSPDETWEDENLNKLDIGLKKTFDLQARFRTIQEGLGIVKENLELFRDILQYRNSTVLEWIIIILIFVEVVNLFFEKIFK